MIAKMTISDSSMTSSRLSQIFFRHLSYVIHHSQRREKSLGMSDCKSRLFGAAALILVITTALLITARGSTGRASVFSGFQRDAGIAPMCSGVDDTEALKAATARAGPGSIVISAGKVCAATSVTLVNVRVQAGGTLKPLDGHTITISGNFEAGPYATFPNSSRGSGKISFSATATVKEILPQWWGAVADATVPGAGTDSTLAFQSAINAAADRTLFLPRQVQAYRISSRLSINHSMSIVSDGATILFDFPARVPAAEGRLFDVKASSVEFRNIKIDGGGVVSTNLAGNRYAIIVDNGVTAYSNIKVQNCTFTNMGSYAGKLPASLSAMHGVYGSYTDGLSVEDCLFDSISGSAVQVNHGLNTLISHNVANKVGWYVFHLGASNLRSKIVNNTVKGSTAAAPVYWGGGIDVMGQTDNVSGGGKGDRDILISGNYLTGTYKYTAALRLASASDVMVSDNTFDQCEVSSIQPDLNPVTYPTNSSVIIVTARDIGSSNGPSNRVTIHHNKAIAKGMGQKFISATTTSGTFINQVKAEGLTIDHNEVVSVDAQNYFSSLLALSAATAGYEDITLDGNYFQGAPIVNVPANLYDGAVAFSATTGKPAQKITITNNQFVYFPGASVPGGARPSGNAIYLEQYCDGLTMQGNTIASFATGIYLNRNAGLSLGIRGIGHDSLTSVPTPLTIVDPETKVFGEFSGTLNVASLPRAEAGKLTIEIPVIGARRGDHVTLNAPSAAALAAVESSYVSSDNNVRVVISATSLANVMGQWSVRISK